MTPALVTIILLITGADIAAHTLTNRRIDRLEQHDHDQEDHQ